MLSVAESESHNFLCLRLSLDFQSLFLLYGINEKLYRWFELGVEQLARIEWWQYYVFLSPQH